MFNISSQQYKVCVIKTLLYRAYHISENYYLLDNEFEKIKQHFNTAHRQNNK